MYKLAALRNRFTIARRIGRFTRTVSLLLAVPCLHLGTFGCSEATPLTAPAQPRGGSGATSQVVNAGDSTVVVQAGSDALRNYFDSVRARPNAGTIDAGPSLYTRRGGSERIGDQTLKPNNQFRRSGKIWVTENKGQMVAHCQIRVQRLDTSEYIALRTNDEFTDLPNSTPIDSDAGLRADQKQVWTDLPRDTALEREILQILLRRLNGEPAATTDGVGE